MGITHELLCKVRQHWRGGRPASPGPAAIPTGFPALDAALPGGGWPLGALMEVLEERQGIGALSLFLPALAHLSGEGGGSPGSHPPTSPMPRRWRWPVSSWVAYCWSRRERGTRGCGPWNRRCVPGPVGSVSVGSGQPISRSCGACNSPRRRVGGSGSCFVRRSSRFNILRPPCACGPAPGRRGWRFRS